MNKEEVKLYSLIIRRSQRTKIISQMTKPLTPTQIKKQTGFSLNNISDILRFFVKSKIAKCLNESDKLGRIYELTEIGERIRRKISE
jgi:predicted transcriptional regulator